MASHVVVALIGQSFPVRPVSMEDHGRRLITTAMTCRQQAVPQLRVLAAPRSSRSQSLVEEADALKGFAAECHVGTRAKSPDRNSHVPHVAEKVLVEIQSAISPTPTETIA